jgi:hypothetical protein
MVEERELTCVRVHVLVGSESDEMPRVHTKTVPAEMVYVMALVRVAIGEPEGDPVRSLETTRRLSIDANASVASAVRSTRPGPTGIRPARAVYLAPEPLFEGQAASSTSLEECGSNRPR